MSPRLAAENKIVRANSMKNTYRVDVDLPSFLEPS